MADDRGIQGTPSGVLFLGLSRDQAQEAVRSMTTALFAGLTPDEIVTIAMEHVVDSVIRASATRAMALEIAEQFVWDIQAAIKEAWKEPTP